MLTSEPHNLEALKYRVVHGLCRVGPSSEPAQNLKALYAEMDRSETNNAALFVQMAQLFSRLVSLTEGSVTECQGISIDSG